MNSNPVVLITGATKGIGRAIVERFAATASELHVVARNQDDLNAMKTALEATGRFSYTLHIVIKDTAGKVVAEAEGQYVVKDFSNLM